MPIAARLKALKTALSKRGVPTLVRYASAILALLLATLVRFALHPLLENYYPFSTYLGAVLLAAWLGGLGPSVLALLVGALLANYHPASPSYTPWLSQSWGWVGFSLYLFTGSVTIALIESLRKRKDQAQKNAERLHLAAQAAAFGTYDVNLETGVTYWSPELKALLGLPPDASIRIDEDQVPETVHPEDRERVRQAILASLDPKGSGEIASEHRIVQPGGGVRWVLTKGKTLFSGQGSRRYAARAIGTVLDITERKQADQALYRSQEMLRRVADTVSVLIAYIDRDLRFQHGSLTYEKWFGINPEGMRGLHLKEVVGEQAFRAVERDIRRALAGEAVAFYREIPYRVIGSRYMHVQYIPDNADGQVQGLFSVAMDLTEYRRMAEHDAQLAAIVESSSDAIVSKNLEGMIKSWNKGAERLFGYTAEEAIGRPITLLMPPDRSDEERFIMERIKRGELIDHYETVRIRKDGSPIELSLTISPIRDAQGKIIGASKIARDITEKRRAEEALRASAAREQAKAMALQIIMDTVPAAVFIAQDPDCRTVTANRAGYEILRLPFGANTSKTAEPDEIPKHFRICKDGVEIPLQELPVQRAARGEEIRDYEEKIVFEDGSSRDLFGNAVPLLDEEGRAQGSVAAFVDITERRRVEEALKEADRRKDEFLATLAHELRNPLTPIVNSLQLITLRGDDPAIRKKAVAMAERQVNNLVRLVDDLLDVSRITRGKIQLRKERVTLAAVIQSALETSRPQIEAGEHALVVDLPEEPVYLKVDPTRIAQAISNLLVNAAKYTPLKGRIQLAARREGQEAVIVVQDNGIGISKAMLPKLFDMFVQSEHSPGHVPSGLGIGLALVKSLVELHEGRIEAASAGPGQGSAFTLRLAVLERPLAEQPSNGLSTGDSRSPQGRRILVIDDNMDAADSIAALLHTWGHDTHVAYEGMAAIEAARRYHPDAILLDLGMPGMDGFEVARRLRQEPGLQKALLIALTGWGQAEDRQRTREAGFDHHLVKPVDPQVLEAMLGRDARDS